MAAPPPLLAWIRATFLGWLLGVFLAVLLAVGGDSVGLSGAQFMLGVGMGVGVGWSQQRSLRKALGEPVPWMRDTVFGLALPFLLGDLLKLAGVDLPYSLPLYVAIGGLLTGLLQRRRLTPKFGQTGTWPVASLVGWTLGAGAVPLADKVEGAGLSGALTFIGVVLLGGLALGGVTGAALSRLPPRPPASPAPNPP